MNDLLKQRNGQGNWWSETCQQVYSQMTEAAGRLVRAAMLPGIGSKSARRLYHLVEMPQEGVDHRQKLSRKANWALRHCSICF